MAIDAAQYIGNIDETLPTGADFIYEGDDQLRATKKAVRQTFANVTGPVTATQAELNATVGATSPLQAQIDLKAPLASPALTGTPTAPTAAAATATKQLATTEFVQATVAGVAASQAAMVLAINSATSINAAAGQHLVLTAVTAATVTLPAAPASGDTIWVTPGNGLSGNVIAANGNLLMGLSEDMTVDNTNATVALRFINAAYGWRML